jgi:hypothetical protein
MMSMAHQEEEAQAEILDRLAESREELRRLLKPPRRESYDASDAMPGDEAGEFPRSRIMQMLMSGRGVGILISLAGGFLIARPALALRLLRVLPVNQLGRMLFRKAFTGRRERRRAKQE